MSFFREHGDTLQADESESLRDFLESIDSSVPSRSNSRTNDDIERYAIVRAFRCPAVMEQLEFPLRLVKSESPDFLIFIEPEPGSHRSIGLEISTLTEERHEAALSTLDRRSSTARLDGGVHISDRSQPVTGRGLAGNESEERWRDALESIVRKKASKLLRYQQCDEFWLVLYDNSGVGVFVDDATAKRCWGQIDARLRESFSLVVRIRSERILALK